MSLSFGNCRHPWRVAILLSFAAYCLTVVDTVGAQAGAEDAGTSSLWGGDGELFDPAGRLPDVSHAGHQNGAADPAALPQVVDAAAHYGANGFDTVDDAPAIQAALDAAGEGAVFLSAGTYYLDRPLQIRKSNQVLRGAGTGKTILRPRVPLDTLLNVSGHDANYGRTAYIEIVGPNPAGQAQWPASYFALRARLGTKVTDVVGSARRGDKALTVADASRLAPRQHIRLRMWEAADNSLGCYLHADLACLGEQYRNYYAGNFVDWVVTIQSISGNVIQIDHPLRLDIRAEWSPQIWTHTPPIRNSGVENLTIEFPNQPYGGHHFELGWHAVWIGFADNCWARDLEILDADRGIEVTYSTRAYIGNIYFGEPNRGTGFSPGRHGVTGHYGVAFTGLTQDSLAENLDIDAHYVHNLSVATFSNGNVYSSVRTLTGAFDHHGGAPYDNVLTDIVIWEDASDLFLSGGTDPRAGFGTTFWNIRRESASTLDFPPLPSGARFPVLTLMGIERWPTQYGLDRYIQRELDTPVNIYEAQIAGRPAAGINPPCREWRLDRREGDRRCARQ